MQIRPRFCGNKASRLSVEPAELAPPGPGEVLVEVKAAGVCHSDLHATNGDWPMRRAARARPRRRGHRARGRRRRHARRSPAITSSCAGRRRAAPVRRAWPGTPLLCDRLDKTTFRNKLPFGGTRLSARGQEVAPVSRHRVLCDPHRCARKRRSVRSAGRGAVRGAGRRGLRGRHRRRRGDQRGAESRPAQPSPSSARAASGSTSCKAPCWPAPRASSPSIAKPARWRSRKCARRDRRRAGRPARRPMPSVS